MSGVVTALKDMERLSLERIDSARASPPADPKTLARGREECSFTVAGLRVTDDAKLSAWLKDAMSGKVRELDKLLESKQTLLDHLAKCGVTPLATVPTKSWARLCADKGLVTVTPDSDGEVQVAVGRLADRLRATVSGFLDRRFWKIGLGLWFTGLASCVLVTRFGFHLPWGAVAFFTVMSAFAGGIASSMTASAFTSNTVRGVRAMLNQMGDAEVTRAVLENRSGSGRTSVRLNLPVPPPEVVPALLALQGLHLGTTRVTAEPLALGIAPQVKTAVLRKIRHDIEAEAAARARALDPIVHVDFEGVTAIVCQFGEGLEIEREVVDRACSVEFLV